MRQRPRAAPAQQHRRGRGQQDRRQGHRDGDDPSFNEPNGLTALPADVARRVGYDSEEAFSRAFKRTMGIAPGAARAAASRPVS